MPLPTLPLGFPFGGRSSGPRPPTSGLLSWVGPDSLRWQNSARTVPAAAGDPARVLDGIGGTAGLSAPSDAARGQVDAFPLGSGVPGVYLDDITSQYALSGVSYNAQNYGVYLGLVWYGDRRGAQGFWEPATGDWGTVEAADDDAVTLLFGTTSPARTLVRGYNVVGLISSPSGHSLRVNGAQSDSGGLAIPSNARTGGTVGNLSAGRPLGHWWLADFLLYDHAPTAGEQAGVESYLNSGRTLAGRFPTTRPLVTFFGNSLVYGSGASTEANSFAHRTIAGLGTAYTRYYTYGVPGVTTPNLSSTYYTPHIAPLYSASRTKNVLLVWEITNDIGSGGATGATAYANIKALCQAAKNAGFLVIVLDCATRSDAGWTGAMETARTACNTSLAGDFTGATSDALVKTAAGGTTYADVLVKVSGLTLTRSDGVHPDDAGHQAVADKVVVALAALGVT